MNFLPQVNAFVRVKEPQTFKDLIYEAKLLVQINQTFPVQTVQVDEVK